MTIRTILPVTIIAALGCASFITLQTVHNPATSKNSDNPIIRNAFFSDFDFTEYSKSGLEKKFTIQGRRLAAVGKRFGRFYVSAAKVTEIKDARVIFYNANKPVSTITAKRAVLDTPFDKGSAPSPALNRIDFSEDVTVITSDRRILECKRLSWNKPDNGISAQGACRLIADGKRLRADFIDSDVELRNYNLRNDRMKRLRALGRAVI